MSAKKLFLSLSVLACVISSCSKDTAGNLCGSYTYKLSGTITIVDTLWTGEGVPDTLTMALTPEQGQLNVLRSGDFPELVVLTFNDIMGDASVTSASVSGGSLFIAPFEKTVSVKAGLLETGFGVVEANGIGRKFDDVIVMDFSYSGDLDFGSTRRTIISSSISCVAKEN